MKARFMLTVLALCALTSLAFAQALTSVSGRVTDPSGAAVPDATLILENVATGLRRQASSNAEGAYGAGDPGFSCLFFFELGYGGAGDMDAGGIDFSDFILEPVAAQPE